MQAHVTYDLTENRLSWSLLWVYCLQRCKVVLQDRRGPG